MNPNDFYTLVLNVVNGSERFVHFFGMEAVEQHKDTAEVEADAVINAVLQRIPENRRSTIDQESFRASLREAFERAVVTQAYLEAQANTSGRPPNEIIAEGIAQAGWSFVEE